MIPPPQKKTQEVASTVPCNKLSLSLFNAIYGPLQYDGDKMKEEEYFVIWVLKMNN